MWAAHDADERVIAAMDPTGNATEIYSRELAWRYAGNRAPLGLFLHAGKCTPTVTRGLHWLQLSLCDYWSEQLAV